MHHQLYHVQRAKHILVNFIDNLLSSTPEISEESYLFLAFLKSYNLGLKTAPNLTHSTGQRTVSDPFSNTGTIQVQQVYTWFFFLHKHFVSSTPSPPPVSYAPCRMTRQILSNRKFFSHFATHTHTHIIIYLYICIYTLNTQQKVCIRQLLLVAPTAKYLAAPHYLPFDGLN